MTPTDDLIGYARISTSHQDLSAQKEALAKAGVQPERMFCDVITGGSTSRKALDECLASLEPGSTLVVQRLDRLGRSLPHLVQVLSELEARGCFFRSIAENVSTEHGAGPANRLLLHLLCAVADFEKSLIQERTVLAMRAAKEAGRPVGGRPRLLSREAELHDRKLIEEDGFSYGKVAKLLKVSPKTIRRAVERVSLTEQSAGFAAPERAADVA